MSQKELQRMKVVENAVSGRLKVSEAAELLQLSERQVTRLKGRVTGEAVDRENRGTPDIARLFSNPIISNHLTTHSARRAPTSPHFSFKIYEIFRLQNPLFIGGPHATQPSCPVAQLPSSCQA